MLEKLKQFQANRKQYNNINEVAVDLRTNTTLKHDIDQLSRALFHKEVSGCINCYLDAYVHLMNLKIDDAIQKLQCPFALREGALLQDFDDPTKLCSQANLTTRLALHHLAKNPASVKYFILLPDNWQQQAEEYRETMSQLKDTEYRS